jgi:glutamine amidotransferase
MCRLLYINSKEEFSVKHYLEKFAEIANSSKEYQGHGWGFAYLYDGNWNYYKNVKPIWEDNFSKFGFTTRLIAHARSAFKDEGIVVENNMPFFDNKYIFIFNGELRSVKIKEDGRIGAEKIFNYIKRFDKGSMKEAIEKGTEIIKKKSNFIRAMNFIIADNSSAYVYSCFNDDPEYFTMQIHQTANNLIICSQKLTNENEWIPIQNNSLMEIPCF